MAFSINEEIKIGGKIYHIQTEICISKKKLITNIFVNGKVIKKLEKDISEKDLESGETCKKVTKAFHESILRKLLSKNEPKKSQTEEKKGITIDKDLESKIVEAIFPIFGIETEKVIKTALKNATDHFSLMENIIYLTPEEKKERLKSKLEEILDPLKEINSRREEILLAMSEYFGIASNIILEDSIEMWRKSPASKRNVKDFIKIIKSNLEDKEEQEKLAEKLYKILFP